MKFKDLIKFIDQEVEQVVNSEENIKESSTETVQQCKPITINIKKINKTKKEKELEEMDFEETMFYKLDESILRNKIRKILSEDTIPGDEEFGHKPLKSKINPIHRLGIAQSNPIHKLGSKVNGKALSYNIYNDSFSKACQEAIDFAKQKGYDVDDNDWFVQVSSGPRKPDPGKTNRYSIELLKDGIPTKKFLHFQVYGMESGKFELNAYLSSK